MQLCWRHVGAGRIMIILFLCSCMATLRLCTWLQELELILDWYVRTEALEVDWLRKNQRTMRAELYGWACNYFVDAYTVCIQVCIVRPYKHCILCTSN